MLTKLPVSIPLIVLVLTPELLFWLNEAETIELLVELSLNTSVGLFVSVKSIITFPWDSVQFSIPSLSLSISRLSIIPSLSLSSGQILTGTSTDSNISPVHVITPTSLYFPGFVGVISSVVKNKSMKPPPVPSSNNHWKLSKFSILAADKVKLGIQSPSVENCVLKFISGADGNPE